MNTLRQTIRLSGLLCSLELRPSRPSQEGARVVSSLRALSRAQPRSPFCCHLCRGFTSTAARRSSRDAGEEPRKWSTPLAKQLAEAISTTGPIPVATYMRMCLTSDLGGYYTGALEDGQGRDLFGRTGDFVTSPEVSQIFGELVGIWFVAEWMAQGRPSGGVELMEVGPGRGTLMDDILRTVRHFGLARSIETIYMVEASAQLRETQKKRLCGDDAVLSESKMGYHGVCKHGSLPIVWTETTQSIPHSPNTMPFIVAHELFDALPIHVFQSVPAPRPSASASASHTNEWREMVVSPTPPHSTHATLNTPRSQRDGPVPDFQMALSSGPTRHSRHLPDLYPRLSALLSLPPGTLIEICPDAAMYAADFAVRIGGSRSSSHSSSHSSNTKTKPSGAALILDYGPADGSVPINSLRGIRNHRRVSPFAEPGLTDLSTDVDFAALADAALAASHGVEVHGPVQQADFLLAMGIRERAQALIHAKRKSTSSSETKASAASVTSAEVHVEQSWKRLVDRGPDGMGKVYKALAIIPENDGRRRPVGFGGDIVQ